MTGSRRPVKYDKRKRCRRCFETGAAVAGCCGWVTCQRCTESGYVDARRGFPLCRECVRFRLGLDRANSMIRSNPGFDERRNPDVGLEEARRRYVGEGGDVAARAYVRAAVRSQRLQELPVGLFLQALREDPFVLGALPGGDVDELMAAGLVVRMTEPENWFPAHRSLVACPRGHHQGVPAVSFDFIYGGPNIYHRVTRADTDHDLTTIELGTQESSTSIADFLLCSVCNAVWPHRGHLDFE